MNEKFKKQYEYQLSKSQGIITLVLFGLLAWFGINRALHDTNGLTIRHTIELSPQLANYFWWGSAILFVMLALMGLMMLIKSWQAPSVITLTDYDITAPKKPISSKIVTVKYSDINKLKIHNIAKVRQLRLDSPQGKIVIPDVNFVNKHEFDELVNILRQKVRH